MIKHLQILFSGLGGHASVVFSLLDAMAPEDRKSQHLIFYGTEPIKEEYRQRCLQLGVSFDAVVKTEKLPFAAWNKVLAALHRIRPAAIWLHSINLIFPVKYYSASHKTKIVAIEHTPNQVKRKVEWLCSRYCMRWADKIVLLTEGYREELQAALGKSFQKSKTQVIGNGIDTQVFCPATNPISAKQCHIGMAARFSDTKNQRLLIDAFQQLAGQFPTTTLTLAGLGETRAELISYAQSLACRDRIHFPGNLDEAPLIEFYQSLDIYVHASLGETMSTSVMQAMACGLPILAADIPGINNMIDKGSNGALFGKDNVADLVSLITDVITNPEKYRAMASNARKKAVSHYSNAKMLAAYLSL